MIEASESWGNLLSPNIVKNPFLISSADGVAVVNEALVRSLWLPR